MDSNSAYIAEKLEEKGVFVSRHICVGDDLKELRDILFETAARADIAIVTGGLGPTVDDRTAQAAAEAGGVKLRLNPMALEIVEKFFKNNNFPMSAGNRKQAFLPDNSVCMDNPVGSAPGFELRIGNCVFFFMPGVPHEMKQMLQNEVLPAAMKVRGDDLSHSLVRTIGTFGYPESVVDEKVCHISEKYPGITLGMRATFPVIQVKLYGRGKSRETLEAQLAEAGREVCDILGESVFSEEGDSMEQVLGKLLSAKGATVAIAESCTGGLISSLLTDVPGSSDYFLFSGVTYSNEAKEKVLGIPHAVFVQYGAVHEETAKQMAIGARRVSGADYAIATSGIAGPGGGSDEKPVGTLCVGLATVDDAWGYRYNFPFRNRGRNKKLFAVVAMNKLRQILTNS